MTATEIRKIEKTTLRTKPVLIQGIMQQSLLELTTEVDAVVNGLKLRLPVGTVISLIAHGSGGPSGSLMTDRMLVRALNGELYRASSGMQLRLPPAE